ncbi:MAG: hypothetical protein CYG60_15615 [Actinobacteria bacterium]|nr:MAG: hypothetical protein CYG60_15615 [Actinomycetota bacterium]
MGRSCTVCEHEERGQLNRALVRGSESEREIASRFGLTQAAVDRHRRNHLRPYLAELIREDPELAELSPLSEIKGLYFRVRRLLNQAEDAQDWPAAKAFHSEARRDLELLARVVGDIDDSPKINILISPDVQQVIIGALSPYPEARLAVADALASLETTTG